MEDVQERIDGEHDVKRLFVPYPHLVERGCEFRKACLSGESWPGDMEGKVV